MDVWRLRRAFRFELSLTDKPDAGMSGPGMSNFLRYLNSASRQFDASFSRILKMCEQKAVPVAAHLAIAAASRLGDEQQTLSAAANALPQSALVSAESIPTTPTTGQPEAAGKGEPLAESLPPTAAAASARPGDSGDGTREERVDSAAAAEAAQPAPGPAVSSTPASEEERRGSPGKG